MKSSKWITLLASTLLACSQQAQEGSIEGEVAPTLQGIVEAPSIDTDSVDVLVLWSFYPSMLDEEPATLWPADRVQVHGVFPSEFTLGAIEPPPDFVLEGGLVASNDPGGSRVAEGYIVAVSPGTNIDTLAFTDIVGSDRAHSIAYVESDIEPGSFGEYLLGPLGAGFHLIAKQPQTRDCEADPDSEHWYQHADGTGSCYPRVLRPTALGFATPLEIEGQWSGTDASGTEVTLPYLIEPW